MARFFKILGYLCGGCATGTRGIYYWNGTTWVPASLPSTSAADSGKILTSNGSTWVASYFTGTQLPTPADTLKTHSSGIGFSLSMVLDTVYTIPVQMKTLDRVAIITTGTERGDWCFATYTNSGTPTQSFSVWSNGSALYLSATNGVGASAGTLTRIRCLRLIS